MLEIFKCNHPNPSPNPCCIDATEFAIEGPSSFLCYSSTFSNYRNRNTVKILLVGTPSGPISNVIRDQYLIKVGGSQQSHTSTFRSILKCTPLCQMTSKDVILTKIIAQLRVYVERAIGRVNNFHILKCIACCNVEHNKSSSICVLYAYKL